MSEVAIKVIGLSKAYAIFNRPEDRLKQMLMRKRRKYYREFWALRDVNLEIRRGETVGIIGANGSGKSTLLQLVCGNLTQTHGEVTVNGRVAALLELGAGFNPEFTGRENVFINAAILGYEEREIGERFGDIAAFAGIGQFIDQPVKSYSSGMYARLAFAVAINVDPDILLVDEALAVGDEAFQRKCYARIEEIKRGGGTILFVSHSAQAIVDLCDRAVMLHAGKRLFTGEPRKAVSLYQKLVNAPPEYSERIQTEIEVEDRNLRCEIEADSISNPSHVAARKMGSRAASKPTEENDINYDGQGSDLSTFDSTLISESTVAYPPNGAEIRNPRIVAQDGRIVNCLTSGARYRICYDVLFQRDCQGISFFTMIRTVTGVPLGGGAYPPRAAMPINARAGQEGTIAFEFRCLLNSGTYFINCQVRSAQGESLHRIVDAVAFRVELRSSTFVLGAIDFECSPELTLSAGRPFEKA